MKRAILGTILLLAATGGALAQSSSESRPGPGMPARGAEIRIERPDMSLFVRCGEGETAKSCSETATQLMEKVAAMPAPERRGGRGGGFERDRDERRHRDRD